MDDGEPVNICLEGLSDDLLTVILSKLPLKSLAVLSCTSKRMHQLCHKPGLWTSVGLNDTRAPITPYEVSVLCGKGAYIRHLSIDLHHTLLPDSLLRYLSCSCSSLVSLSLYMSDGSPISGNANVNVFPVEELVAFLKNSKYIRSLRFVDSVLLDDSKLVKLLPHLQMMREIDLSGCKCINDPTIVKLAQQCPSLQVLDISRLMITGRCIEQIFRYCGGLKVLRLNQCSELESDAFDQVHPDNLKNLTELSLIQTPASLERVLQYCTGLTSLYASSSLHDSVLIPFLQKHPLEILYMGSGCRVTICSLITVIQNSGSKLRSLTFHPSEDCAVPSDEVLRLLCTNCPNLTNLSLTNTREISTYWVREILNRMKLETLALFGWENANSSTLKLIAPYLGNLKMLCVTGCRKLTPKGVYTFINSAPKLLVFKANETGANIDASGKFDPSILDNIREQFPSATENPPGTLVLQ